MDLIFQVILATILVLAFMFLALRLLRSYMRSAMASKYLEVIEAVGLGRNARVVLLRVGDDHLVLGVSNERITRLTDFDPDTVKLPADNGDDDFASFSRTLRSFLNQEEDAEENDRSDL